MHQSLFRTNPRKLGSLFDQSQECPADKWKWLAHFGGWRQKKKSFEDRWGLGHFMMQVDGRLWGRFVGQQRGVWLMRTALDVRLS